MSEQDYDDACFAILAWAEEIKQAPRVERRAIVVDHRVALSDHLELVPTDHDRRVLIKPDTQKIGVRADNLDEVELTIAAKQVLVNRDVSMRDSTSHSKIEVLIPDAAARSMSFCADAS